MLWRHQHRLSPRILKITAIHQLAPIEDSLEGAIRLLKDK